MRDAVDFPNPAFQVAGNEMGPKGNGRMPAPSEDCLYLNIWTPAADCKGRPVMFYNHGGGYMIGSGSAIGQDGNHLAQLYDHAHGARMNGLTTFSSVLMARASAAQGERRSCDELTVTHTGTTGSILAIL